MRRCRTFCGRPRRCRRNGRRDPMPAFARYIGIDYSGAKTPSASLKGLRVYRVEGDAPPVEVLPPPSPRKYWCPYRKLDSSVAVTQAADHGLGIRDRPIAPRSPWQNEHVEWLIGSIRRERTNHMIVFGEAHLRRIMTAYAAYYNEARTHLSLGKDAPIGRSIEHLGHIIARPVVGGLHHRYRRIWFSAGTGGEAVGLVSFGMVARSRYDVPSAARHRPRPARGSTVEASGRKTRREHAKSRVGRVPAGVN